MNDRAPSTADSQDPRISAAPLPPQVLDALDIAPLSDPGSWLVLSPDPSASQRSETSFVLTAWDGPRIRTIGTVVLPPEDGDYEFAGRPRRPRVFASPGGEFAVVGLDHGRFGAVADLGDGRVTTVLDQGSYCPETVPFGASFAVHEGRPVLVHRTDWNRLDVSDPATGELLTARTLSEGDDEGGEEDGDERGTPALDYFHGALAVSPDNRWVADNGWVWQPFAVATAWSLTAWLSGNPGESENGPTLHELRQGDDWLTPMCWLDERLVAFGETDPALTTPPGGGRPDGVRIVDVETGDESLSFPGPRGNAFFSQGDRLYIATGTGLEIWDFRAGTLVGSVPGFTPTHHHPASRIFARLDGPRLLTLDIAQSG